MRILFQSYAFYPSCGGIESSALLFIREFRRQGHEVHVQTLTPLGDANELELDGVTITRNPKLGEVLNGADWADVVYQHNPSLRLAMMLCLKPAASIVVSIRTWMRRADGSTSLADRVKQFWVGRQTVISNSKATAQHLSGPSTVIENAYDDQIFTVANTNERTGMAFVGRLVSDKGVRTALEALQQLRAEGTVLPLTIIGDGPEREALEGFARNEGLAEQVHFVGRKSPAEVAATLNQCKYHVIPSLWAEPFGIVALEGIACGCVPLGTNHGGLVDAIGTCGPLFEPGDATGLAQALSQLEQNPDLYDSFKANHAAHLQCHSPYAVADRYLSVFNAASKGTTN